MRGGSEWHDAGWLAWRVRGSDVALVGLHPVYSRYSLNQPLLLCPSELSQWPRTKRHFPALFSFPSTAAKWERLAPHELAAQLHSAGRCSAVVRVTPDLSDLLLGHSAWWEGCSNVHCFNGVHCSSGPTVPFGLGGLLRHPPCRASACSMLSWHWALSPCSRTTRLSTP